MQKEITKTQAVLASFHGTDLWILGKINAKITREGFLKAACDGASTELLSAQLKEKRARLTQYKVFLQVRRARGEEEKESRFATTTSRRSRPRVAAHVLSEGDDRDDRTGTTS